MRYVFYHISRETSQGVSFVLPLERNKGQVKSLQVWLNMQMFALR